MPATLTDFTDFANTAVDLSDQWPVLARCVQSLTAYFQAKISTGVEPADVLSGMYLGVDGQSTTTRDWRFFVSSTNGFFIQENTGTDVAPVWADRLSLPLGGGLVSPHATSHQHGGTDEVGTATPGANALVKADGSGLLATGWLTGVVRNAEIAAAAAIALNKLAALTASRVPVLDGSGFLTASGVTDTTLAFLDATSSVQTQLNSKLNLSGGVLSGNLDLDGFDLILNAAGTTIFDDAGGAAGSTAGAGAGNILARVAGAGVDQFRVLTTGSIEIQSTDAGATSGPFIRTFRNSASPAAADNIGGLSFLGKDSAGNDQLYGGVYSVIEDATSGSEDSRVNVNVTVNGVDTTTLQFNGTGLRVSAQTASRVPYLDANKDLVVSAVTPTELGFLSGVTSAIQTQINGIAAGGLALLQVYTPSAVASVDMTSVITSTYDRYLILYDLRPATDGVTVYVRTDTSNGASFDIGAGDYQTQTFAAVSTTAAAIRDAANTQINLTSGNTSVGNATNEGCTGVLWLLFKGSASMYPVFLGFQALLNTATATAFNVSVGSRNSAAAINAVQLLFSSGNITSGTVRIYGVKN